MESKAIIVAAVAFLQHLAFATDYHVDSKIGDDANDGLSAATAFKTLERAAKRLKAGDVLNLAAGSLFSEALVIKASGTAAKPILIRGNGVVVSGRHPMDGSKWETKGGDLWFQANNRCWGALRPRVFIGDEMISLSVKPQDLKPRTAVWRKEGTYFRAESGKSPRDYALLGGVGRSRNEHSGVIIDGQSYITIENLVAQHFPNDGFNVHGTCRGLVFRNIVARHNGDDGFSIHDDVCATVVGLHSHHNDFGIQDVGFSQTIVSGAVLEQNRLCGFDEHCGIRILRDSVIRANGVRQIGLHSPRSRGKSVPSLMGLMTAYLESVRVEGGEGDALFVEDGVKLIAKNCSFSETKVGLSLSGGQVHLESCTVSDCATPAQIAPACAFSQDRCKGIR